MKLKTKLEDLSSVKKKLSIEISAEDAGAEYGKAINEFRKYARIPGFRPGKAPLPLVKSRFREDLKGEVYKKLVPEAYDQAIQEQGLKPVGQPDLDDLQGEEGEAITFKAVFEVRPKIELPEYKGLELEVDDEKITDADVDARLAEVREAHAELVAVEDRPIQDKDVVIINMKGSYLDGKEAGDEKEISKEGLTVTVGDERTLPEFTENLRGLNNGDDTTFELEYEKEYPTEELAGRKVRYRVEVVDIKAPELPELDDEFVKELGNYESLAKFKEELKVELTRKSTQNREDRIRNSIVEKLVESSEFEVPSVMVEARLDERLKDFAGRLISQGVNPEQANFDWAAYRESMRPMAERDVRATLLLEKIAEKEEISIGDEDVDAEIATLAEDYKQPVERVRQLLLKEENLDGIKDDLRRRKVFDLLIGAAKISSGKSGKPGKAEKKPAVKAAAKKAEKPTGKAKSAKAPKAEKSTKSEKTEKE